MARLAAAAFLLLALACTAAEAARELKQTELSLPPWAMPDVGAPKPSREDVWGNIQAVGAGYPLSYVYVFPNGSACLNYGVGNIGCGNNGSFNVGFGNIGDFNHGSNNNGDFNGGDVNLGSFNSGSRNAGSHNSGSDNNGNYNTGNKNDGNANGGDMNTGTLNSGNANHGTGNSGMANLGDWNSGNDNAGSHNSGSQDLGDWNEASSVEANYTMVPGGAPLPETDEEALAYLAFLEALPPIAAIPTP